jgi:protein-tyrosine kinase
VDQLGKIFDALEKSRKKDNTSVAPNETLGTVKVDQPKNQEPFFYKTASLKREKKSAVFSYKDLDNYEKSKREKQSALFDRTKVLYDHNNIEKNLVALLKPRSFEAEQFKQLRTNLFFPVSGKVPRAIIVSSAVPSEGKSFVAANLAVSIAQSLNEHVLIIDCDLRKPSIHKQFGFSETPGLSEHLSSGTPLSSLLLKTKVSKLNILPAGKPPQNPAELISSQQMLILLEEAKKRYRDRYIVIDSPPPKFAAEANAILMMVDGVILVVEYRNTPRDMVSSLVEKMGKEKVLGIVFNKYNFQLSKYYGYGKYSKYNKYYDNYK